VATNAIFRRSFRPATGRSYRARTRRLYAVEREAKELFERQGVTETSRPLSAIRLELRQEKSAPLLAAFRPCLQEQTAGPSPVLPKSPMGQAINYGLNNWDALERYTTNGGLNIDNNAAERAMRPVGPSSGHPRLRPRRRCSSGTREARGPRQGPEPPRTHSGGVPCEPDVWRKINRRRWRAGRRRLRRRLRALSGGCLACR